MASSEIATPIIQSHTGLSPIHNNYKIFDQCQYEKLEILLKSHLLCINKFIDN